ncbi:MAG: hypothetical protein KJ666_01800, partial [Bacteroidetes bacterium]|nr:hypothetical protein [Bacteroidota bacterium]
PHKYKNIPYLRSGSATKQMPDSVYTQMLASRPPNLDLTSRIVHGTSITDLSEKALARHKEFLAKRSENWKELNDFETLSDLLLIENNELTYAGILLLGKPETIQKYIPQAELRYFWYASDDDTEYSYHNRDTSSYQPIILQLDLILSEIKTKIINIQMGLFRVEVKEFEREVLQEAILNAIMHRDYRIQTHIFIKHYPSHLEIINPGGFFGGVTSQNIIFHPPRYRNFRLANTLAKVFAVQQAGQGVDIMFKEMVKRGQQLIYVEDKENVALTIPAGVVDKELYSFISKVNEKGILLGLVDLVVLQQLKKGKGLTKSTLQTFLNDFSISSDKVNHSINRLIKEKVIYPMGEKRGRRYFLSNEFYKELGISGEVTRLVGPSKKGIEVTIIDHLKIHGTGKISDFLTALSIPQDDKRLRKRVSKVLAQMHSEGLIAYESKRRWTTYWLKNSSS